MQISRSLTPAERRLRSAARTRNTARSLIGATEVVFGVEGVKSEFGKLKKQGVTFVDEPHEVKGGEEWTTSFTDPDGHLLSIFGRRRP